MKQLDLFSGPDLLERARMVLADCGIDPEGVRVIKPNVITSDGRIIDRRTAWRAVTIARMAKPGRAGMCFACTVEASPIAGDTTRYREALDRCRATLPLTEDCGVSR